MNLYDNYDSPRFEKYRVLLEYLKQDTLGSIVEYLLALGNYRLDKSRSVDIFDHSIRYFCSACRINVEDSQQKNKDFYLKIAIAIAIDSADILSPLEDLELNLNGEKWLDIRRKFIFEGIFLHNYSNLSLKSDTNLDLSTAIDLFQRLKPTLEKGNTDLSRYKDLLLEKKLITCRNGFYVFKDPIEANKLKESLEKNSDEYLDQSSILLKSLEEPTDWSKVDFERLLSSLAIESLCS